MWASPPLPCSREGTDLSDVIDLSDLSDVLCDCDCDCDWGDQAWPGWWWKVQRKLAESAGGCAVINTGRERVVTVNR